MRTVKNFLARRLKFQVWQRNSVGRKQTAQNSLHGLAMKKLISPSDLEAFKDEDRTIRELHAAISRRSKIGQHGNAGDSNDRD